MHVISAEDVAVFAELRRESAPEQLLLFLARGRGAIQGLTPGRLAQLWQRYMPAAPPGEDVAAWVRAALEYAEQAGDVAQSGSRYVLLPPFAVELARGDAIVRFRLQGHPDGLRQAIAHAGRRGYSVTAVSEDDDEMPYPLGMRRQLVAPGAEAARATEYLEEYGVRVLSAAQWLERLPGLLHLQHPSQPDHFPTGGQWASFVAAHYGRRDAFVERPGVEKHRGYALYRQTPEDGSLSRYYLVRELHAYELDRDGAALWRLHLARQAGVRPEVTLDEGGVLAVPGDLPPSYLRCLSWLGTRRRGGGNSCLYDISPEVAPALLRMLQEKLKLRVMSLDA